MATKKQKARKMLEGRNFWRGLATTIGLGAFFQQVVEKDLEVAYSSQNWAGYSGEQKVKFVMGRFLNRVTGINPFPEFGPSLPLKINPWGPVNKFTGIGLGSLLYGLLPVKKLPAKGKVKTIGTSLLFAGIIGGLLDPPPLNPARNGNGQRQLSGQANRTRFW